MLERSRVFFGYPSRPQAQREAMVAAVRTLNDSQQVRAVSWESLRIGGRLIIDRITEAIDDSVLAAFDVTTVNHNVMFELGYAIGREKRVWLLRDDSMTQGAQNWAQLGLLSTVGYQNFRNSEDVARAFFRDQPHELSGALFDDLIRPSLRAAGDPSLFYIPDVHNTEANRLVARRVQEERQHRVRVVVADPTESSAEPLGWYAQELFQAIAVIVHFSSVEREFSFVHNARSSLIAGLALGMGRPLLMLAERDFLAPIDYRGLLYRYPHARAGSGRVNEWLGRTLTEARRQLAFEALRGQATRTVKNLSGLRLGEHVAENEEDALGNYFVPTQDYDQVLAGRAALFVGRKGAGKTANLFQAAKQLSADPRNLVVVVKPVGYEWDSLLKLLAKYVDRDSREYLLLVLWKFLLESEIARAAADQITARPAGPVFGTPDWDLITFISGDGSSIAEDFAVRLEHAVAQLDSAPTRPEIGATRRALADALDTGIARELRAILGRVLRSKARVAVLVDNLDKWERGSDFELLSRFLLALPSSAERLTEDFQRSNSWKEPVPVTVSVFLRSDVFAAILETAHEPDKVPFTRLVWSSPEMLRRVVEERYVAARGVDAARSELWDQYFTPHIGNIPTAEYVTYRVLPRPRDIVFFCNAAITAGVNKGHLIVGADDIADAEKQYSRFAFESILVESEVLGHSIEPVLFEFIGGPSTVKRSEVEAAVRKAAPGSTLDEVVQVLRRLSFLGVETGNEQFDYSEDPGEQEIADRMSRRLVQASGREERYRIHPAFRPYLAIHDQIRGGVLN